MNTDYETDSEYDGYGRPRTRARPMGPGAPKPRRQADFEPIGGDTASADLAGAGTALRITRHALARALAYSRIVAKEKANAECLWLLLADPLGPSAAGEPPAAAGQPTAATLINEVLLAPDQVAGPASVELPPGAVLEAGRQINELGKVAVGWGHSHVAMPAYHSVVDDENFYALARELFPANTRYQYVSERLSVLPSEAELRLLRAGREVGVLQGWPEAAVAAASGGLEVSLLRRVAVATVYSLVLNIFGESYCEATVRKTDLLSGTQKVRTNRVSIGIADDGSAAARTGAAALPMPGAARASVLAACDGLLDEATLTAMRAEVHEKVFLVRDNWAARYGPAKNGAATVGPKPWHCPARNYNG